MGKRILLADPRFVVRSGLRNFFSHEFPDAYIEEATTSQTCSTLLAAHLYDVIVVHQLFLATQTPEGKVIVLAHRPDKELLQLAHTHHAIACIGNDYTEELLRAILKLESGEFLLDPTFSDWLFEQLGENEKIGVQMEQITAKEREVIELRNKGLSYAEIAERLCISMSTVRQHIVNVGRKARIQRQ